MLSDVDSIKMNDSRFIITTLVDAPQVDGKFAALGGVSQGIADLGNIAHSNFRKRGSSNCGYSQRSLWGLKAVYSTRL